MIVIPRLKQYYNFIQTLPFGPKIKKFIFILVSQSAGAQGAIPKYSRYTLSQTYDWLNA